MTVTAYAPTATTRPRRDFTAQNAATRADIAKVDRVALVQRIGVSGLHRVGRLYQCCCPIPGHEENTPSFTVYTQPGGDFFCFGCKWQGDAADLVRTVFPHFTFPDALRFLDITPGPPPPWQPLPARPVTTPAPHSSSVANLGAPTATYEYRDAKGTLLWQKLRYTLPDGTKTFRQRGADGQWTIGAQEPLLYRLPELLAALATQPDAPVFVVEGEKAADRLIAAGLVATTTGGSGRWSDTCSTELAKRDVVILEDNDPAGRRHTTLVKDSLRRCAASTKIILLPNLPPGGDVYDFLERRSIDALLAIAEYAPAEQVAHNTGEIFGEQTDSTDILTQAAARITELETQLAALQTWQAWVIDTLQNPRLEPSDKLVLFGVHEVAEEQQLRPDIPAPMVQETIAAKAGLTTSTVSRRMKVLSAMKAASYKTKRICTVVINPHTKKPTKRWEALSTLTIHQGLGAPGQLATPANADGKRHGGQRCKGCGSDQLERTITVHCKRCGQVQSETVKPVNDPQPFDPVVVLEAVLACEAATKSQDAISSAVVSSKLQDATSIDHYNRSLQLRQNAPLVGTQTIIDESWARVRVRAAEVPLATQPDEARCATCGEELMRAMDGETLECRPCTFPFLKGAP